MREMPTVFLDGHRRDKQVGVANVGMENIAFLSAAGSPPPYDDVEEEGLLGEETLLLEEAEEKEERDDSDGAGLWAS